KQARILGVGPKAPSTGEPRVAFSALALERFEAAKAAIPALAAPVRELTGWAFDGSKVEIEPITEPHLPKRVDDEVRALGITEAELRAFGATPELPHGAECAANCFHFPRPKIAVIAEAAGDVDFEEVMFHELVHAAQYQQHPDLFLARARHYA